MCGHGGIGRRVRFRFLWSQGCAGSSPVVRTKKRQSERVVFFHATADLKQNYVLSANDTAFVCPCTLCSWRNALQVNLLAYAITFASLTTSPVVRTKNRRSAAERPLGGRQFRGIYVLRITSACRWQYPYPDKKQCLTLKKRPIKRRSFVFSVLRNVISFRR